MKKNKIFILGLILSLVPFVLGLIFYNSLPETMAVHFDAMGKPNGYASKNTALFLLPLGLMIAYIAAYFITIKDPKHKNQDGKLNAFIFLFIPFINILVSAFTIAVGLGREIKVNILVPALVGVVFVVIGNFMPKVKRNYTVGIKLPWTLHSDVVWEKTHRLAGYLWMLGGVFIIASSFLIPAPFHNYVLITTVLVASLIPAIYAYLIYRKEEEGK